MVEWPANFCNTRDCAYAENSKPPYSFLMIMAKNLLSFKYCQTFSGKSASSWVASQSLVILHTSSTVPSKKACSSSVKRGAGMVCNFFQSGLPRNISPSHQTVPASRASLSVSDISGIILRKTFRIGEVIKDLRIDVSNKGNKIMPAINHGTQLKNSKAAPMASISAVPAAKDNNETR